MTTTETVRVDRTERLVFITPANDNTSLPTVYEASNGDIEIGSEYIGSDRAEAVTWLRAVADAIEALS